MQAGVADDLDVFRRGQRQDAVAVAHRLDERRVRAADLRGVDVAVSVLLQGTVGVAEDEAREDDAAVAARERAQAADVLVRVGRVADDQKLVRRPHAPERLDDHRRVVFGFEARDVEHVTVRLHPPLADCGAVESALDLRAVNDHRRVGLVFGEVVVLYDARVRHRLVRQPHGESLRHTVVVLPQPVPLAPLVLKPVDVDGDGHARGAKYWREGRVGGVADERGVEASECGGVQRREAGVYDRVEILVADGRQNFQADALVLYLSRADVVCAAVDRHVVAARDEPRRELLGERLEPPVARRNPPRPQNGDAHDSNDECGMMNDG